MYKLKLLFTIAILLLVGIIACGADGSLQWPGSDSSGSSSDIVGDTNSDTSNDTSGDIIINITCSDGSGGVAAGDANSCVLDTDGDGIVNCNDTCWKINNPNQGCDDCIATCSTRRALTQGERFERGDIIVTCGVPDSGVSTSAGKMVYLMDGEGYSLE